MVSDSSLLIRRAREDAGVTQPALADVTGIQQPRLSQYETGKVKPSPETLGRILKALHVRPSIRLEVAQDEVVETAKRFHGNTVWVFGSCADGSDTPDSDVDFMVEFDSDASTYDIANLTESLQALLGVDVDVMSARTPSAQRFLTHAVEL